MKIIQDYERLCKHIEDTELNIDDDIKENFIKNLKKITKEQHEELYVFIKKYYIDDLENKNDKLLTQMIPYEGRKLKKNIKFDFDIFPKNLQKILLLFLEEQLK